MKKNNKKGFTIVELVIVIAVIAILSGVLVGVFTNVIANSKRSAAMQEMKSEWTAYLSADATHASGQNNTYIAIYSKESGSYYAMAIVNGVNANDYTSDEADSQVAAINNLNEKLKGNTISGIQFDNTTKKIVLDPARNTDITNGVEGCSDHVAIYYAKI